MGSVDLLTLLFTWIKRRLGWVNVTRCFSKYKITMTLSSTITIRHNRPNLLDELRFERSSSPCCLVDSFGKSFIIDYYFTRCSGGDVDLNLYRHHSPPICIHLWYTFRLPPGRNPFFLPPRMFSHAQRRISISHALDPTRIFENVPAFVYKIVRQ